MKTWLLNIAHALDHLMLLIFATAVGAIAKDFGLGSWQELMPYTVGAFFMFGLGALPSGRLGDLWGRRVMMIIFFFGIGFAGIAIALTQSTLQLGIALAVMGAFCSIYHPVGIPMLLQDAVKPGEVIGLNGLSGNLGIAAAALLTGYLVSISGWRTAFIVPSVVSIIAGIVFAVRVPREAIAPAKRNTKRLAIDPAVRRKVLLIMTLTATSGSMLFNFSTNSNGEFLKDRFPQMASDPATLGILLAIVYATASFAQVAVGKLIDRYALKKVMLGVLLLQAPVLIAASFASGWWLFAAMLAFMTLIFGAIPFTDAMIARFVDDQMRSRVSGIRLSVSLGASSLAVWLIGPLVKNAGFSALLLVMACIAAITLLFATQLPNTTPVPLANSAD
jgi:MFS family permease